MTTIREAAQQALDVLIRASSYYDTYAEVDALRAALEQPEQEPLCTAAMFDDAFLAKSGLSPDTKLYTHPPQRKPLTDDEIHDCFQQSGTTRLETRRLIARAIEQAHGIGEKE